MVDLRIKTYFEIYPSSVYNTIGIKITFRAYCICNPKEEFNLKVLSPFDEETINVLEGKSSCFDFLKFHTLIEYGEDIKEKMKLILEDIKTIKNKIKKGMIRESRRDGRIIAGMYGDFVKALTEKRITVEVVYK